MTVFFKLLKFENSISMAADVATVSVSLLNKAIAETHKDTVYTLKVTAVLVCRKTCTCHFVLALSMVV